MPLDAEGAAGANQLRSLARDLRRVGDKDLRSEFYRGINRATKPAAKAVKASIVDVLPKHGGLNKFILKSTTVRRKTYTGRNPGIKVIAVGQHDIRNLDKGRLRHPTFGRRGKGDWHDQSITPGMFTTPLEALTPEVRAEVLLLMSRIQRELAGR